MPFIGIVFSGQPYNSRTFKLRFRVRDNPFAESEVIPLKFKSGAICCSHPLVIKIYNVAIRAIIHNQGDYFATTTRKFARKFQYITDCGTTETVKALIIVTDNTNVFSLSRKEENKLLLDIIGILIFVNHDVRDFSLQFHQNIRIFCQEFICLNLNRWKIH